MAPQDIAAYLLNEQLADRLQQMAASPNTYSQDMRAAFMNEAAKRLLQAGDGS